MSRNRYVNTYAVRSVREFDEAILRINETRDLIYRKRKSQSWEHSRETSPLWFRGHEQSGYTLIPSLYRQYEMNDEDGAFGEMHLREDYRFQAFQARAQHRIHTDPATRMDWYEIMQHHFMGTRLMDWSESAYIGLSFALDPYLDPTENDDTKHRRQIIDPVVWVLDPVLLNEKAYDALAYLPTGHSLIEKALDGNVVDASARPNLAHDIQESLKKKSLFFRPSEKKLSYSSSGISSLSSIEAMRQGAGDRMRNMLASNEFNPFFYLIARYYCDGVPVKLSTRLPPLATMHPYHSERIEVQHGAFTCFPYYSLDEDEKSRKKYLLDPRAMEAQPQLSDCLYEINILNPSRVAAQLLDSGMRISHIYPELDRFAKDLEATSFHV